MQAICKADVRATNAKMIRRARAVCGTCPISNRFRGWFLAVPEAGTEEMQAYFVGHPCKEEKSAARFHSSNSSKPGDIDGPVW